MAFGNGPTVTLRISLNHHPAMMTAKVPSILSEGGVLPPGNDEQILNLIRQTDAKRDTQTDTPPDTQTNQQRNKCHAATLCLVLHMHAYFIKDALRATPTRASGL